MIGVSEVDKQRDAKIQTAVMQGVAQKVLRDIGLKPQDVDELPEPLRQAVLRRRKKQQEEREKHAE